MLGLNQYDSDSSSSSSSDEENETEKEKQESVERKNKVEKKSDVIEKKDLPLASNLFARNGCGKKRKSNSNGLFVPPQTKMKRANKSTEDVTYVVYLSFFFYTRFIHSQKNNRKWRSDAANIRMKKRMIQMKRKKSVKDKSDTT